MRLIDADEFKEIINNKIKLCRADGDYTEESINLAEAVSGIAVRLLDMTPTVDTELTHAHWIHRSHDEVQKGDWMVNSDWVGHGKECSNCGTIFMEKIMLPKYRYCPSCGAKMDRPSEE